MRAWQPLRTATEGSEPRRGAGPGGDGAAEALGKQLSGDLNPGAVGRSEKTGCRACAGRRGGGGAGLWA